ncbi:elongation factor P maturation arginine rhamnosyltransferase EarP [Caldimonas thermodepolymerans]|uniref:elongation factor P maturation arginine rhamnosyltransferase EarP n=1 Tax=Caldimonas thermodepolymerans TaxID=215580 RepID=UPI0022369077|nr:elongation factor P maturation arginine rhamnosyltransferase EarP [Caldimonas thermodepolymerans]UZG45856.1 elongation factor P maturation arginine rhamnosyltransferase EarP [Caldimonas thermodepolymerans]
MRWDIFCRVIDNYGDIGVCWRLAADLGARGEQVRLWADDLSALDWMAPHGAPGVEVQAWTTATRFPPPGDVVIEAFGCELPAEVVAGMAARQPQPAWINLEYLSAEDYVERCHGLLSPQFSGPGAGLRKHFFYPGFTPRTGGLLREPGLMAEQPAFDGDAWLAQLGFARQPGERVASLFCYRNPALPTLLAQLAQAPTLLLVTPGLAAQQVAEALGLPVQPGRTAVAGNLRLGWLPPLPQTGFDRLLWACDLNFVRGEDSFVRAQWAGQPFVWHIYPQGDAAHEVKLDAFLDRFLADADPALAAPLRALWHGWNGMAPALPASWPPADAWAAQVRRWRDGLLAQPDLATQLLRFVRQTG